MSGDWTGKTRAGLFWSGSTFVLSKSLTFVSTLVLARLLVPAEFGVVAAVIVYLSFIELASDLGMKATVVYEQEEGVTERVQTAFTVNLAIAVVLTTFAVVLAPTAADFFNLEDQVNLFRLASLSLLFVGLGNIHDSLLLRDLAFRRRIAPELSRGLVRGTVSIGLALSGFGAAALVGGLLAGSAARTIVLWAISPFRPRLSFDAGIARSMMGFGLGAALLEVMSALGQSADILAIGRVLGPTALGLYTVAFRVPELLIQSVSWNVSKVMVPALSRKREENLAGIGAAVLSLIRYQALYTLPVAAGIAVLASPLIVVLFGSAWAPAAGVMAAVAVMAGVSTVTLPLGDVFKALGRQRALVVMSAIEYPLLAVVVVGLAPRGIVAVASALVGAECVYLCVRIVWLSRLVDISFPGVFAAVRPGLAASSGVILGAGAVRLTWDALTWPPLLAGAAAGLLAGLVALRILAPAEFHHLWVRAVELHRAGPGRAPA